MNLKSTKYRLPHLDSAAYIRKQAVQIQQISATSDSGDVRHAEKIFSAGVIRICFFGKQLPIIGIYEPTPLYLLNLSFCITKILFPDYQASGRRLQHIFDAWMPTHVLHCCTYFCICIMFLSSGTDELDLSKLLRVQS